MADRFVVYTHSDPDVNGEDRASIRASTTLNLPLVVQGGRASSGADSADMNIRTLDGLAGFSASSGTSAGNTTLTTGNGGEAFGSGAGGNGGTLSITAGNGGPSSTGSGGDGADIAISAGNAGAGSGGVGIGGFVNIQGGDLEDLTYTGAGSSTQGSVLVQGGEGAPGSSSNGGEGGRGYFSAGRGGTGPSGFAGGLGGTALLIGGQGGTISAATDDGGVGGDAVILGGFGGVGGGSANDGVGGDVVIDGGISSGTGGAAAAGGSIRIGTDAFGAGAFSDTVSILSGNSTNFPPWTHTGSFRLPTVALSDGANIDVDLSQVVNGSVTLGGNRTLDFSNVADGISGVLIVSQDGTGNRTLTMGTNALAPGGSITLSTGANAVDILDYYCDGTNAHVSVRGLAYA